MPFLASALRASAKFDQLQVEPDHCRERVHITPKRKQDELGVGHAVKALKLIKVGVPIGCPEK